MKINQEDTFKPITSGLETRNEANAFIGIIDEYGRAAKGSRDDRYELAVIISSYFTESLTL